MHSYYLRLFFVWLGCLAMVGCSAMSHRQRTNRIANQIIRDKQIQALGRTEPFTIEPTTQTLRTRLLLDQDLPQSGPASLGTRNLEPIDHWPEPVLPPLTEAIEATVPMVDDQPVTITLVDALQIAAKHNRDYQSRKEDVFDAALDLYLERDAFTSIFSGMLEGLYSQDRSDSDSIMEGMEGSITGGVTRRFLNGIELSAELGWDVARLLRPDRLGSRSLFGDASIKIPLLRGSGRHIVGEPLTQAERNVVYAIQEFERFKRTFAVRVATSYLSVLQSLDGADNAEENYRGLITSTRRARRLGDAGKLSPIEVDQSIQDELRARDRWIRALVDYAGDLDGFKILLGLPTDALLVLDRGDMQRLADIIRPVVNARVERIQEKDIPPADAPIVLRQPDLTGGGPMELPEREAIALALANRLDLQIAQGKVLDAQRAVVVAADALRAELTLLGSVDVGARRGVGSASLDDQDTLGDLSLNRGAYEALLTLDLALERTEEAVAYRRSWIELERNVRDVQELEDEIKLDIRNRLRELLQSREALQTQSQAVVLANRRVRSTGLYLQAGRVQIRDLLEAQEDLLDAQNALTEAMVNYRIAALELQGDMGLLVVNEKGLWTEYQPSGGDTP